MTVKEYRLAYSTGDGIGVMQVFAEEPRWLFPTNGLGWNRAQEIVREKYPRAALLAMTPIADEETYSE